MFCEIEQEMIINEFLDVLTVKEYKTKLIQQNCSCDKCQQPRNHKDYWIINKLPLPENIISTIYRHTYECVNCKTRHRKIQDINNLDTITNEFIYRHTVLELLASEHYSSITEIKTKTWVPIKHAMMKLYDESDEKCIDMYDYRRKKLIDGYENILHIQKHGTRYKCSQERLDKIDFNITEAPRRYYNSRHC